jgi:thiol:disulfide interchange protein DsbD
MLQCTWCDFRRVLYRQMLLVVVLLATLATVGPALAADDYLDPESAFQFSAVLRDASTVVVTYKIADGYYMYRERFQFSAEGATLGSPVFPAGKIKFDETFKKNVETYRHAVSIVVPLAAAATTSFTFNATGQGCADLGLCYAPMASQVRLTVGGGGLMAALRQAVPAGLGGPTNAPDSSAVNPGLKVGTAASADAALAGAQVPSTNPETASSGSLEGALKSGRLAAIVPLFLLLGLGLAFTPCVLPMVPILSSIIVGEGAEVSRMRGLVLSLTYALGMAIVYTLLGIGAGLAGEGLAATLQNPWVLGAFGVLMVGLSLSMFDVYTLQMPGAIQQRLARTSHRLRAGRLTGVFLMGSLSALIVGPCVAAPLAGALVYISQTRDVVVGGTALFALAVGMSVPLLLVGVSAGTLLPRAGRWMDAVKRFFGVLMLGVALWMVTPLLPPVLQMLGWAALGIGYGAFLLWSSTPGWALRAVGVVALLLGGLQLVGVATGGRDALAPLAHLRGNQEKPLVFARVKSSAQLDALLAQHVGKPVMLDFYADWCVSCKEMEKLTFTDAGVQRLLADTVLLQADVTANDTDDKALLKRFGLFGPPGIILFDRRGREIPASRIIGYQSAARFATSLAPLAPG